MVGDENQLPPHQSGNPQVGYPKILEAPLFERYVKGFSGVEGDVTSPLLLKEQYRSHESIASVWNNVFYDGRTSSPGRPESRSWKQEELDKAINESNYPVRPLSVIDYSNIASFQRDTPATGVETGHYNNFEASLIGSMVSN